MRTAQSMLFAFGSVAVLALGGCSAYGSGGGSEASSSTSETASASPSVPATPSHSQPSATQPTSEPPASSEQTTPPATEPTTPPQSGGQSPLPRGSEIIPGAQMPIGSDQATVCVNGDGWGMNVIAVNANTSCEFAYEVSDGMVGNLNATQDNIRGHLPKSFQATSPVTGQTYDMTCTKENYELIACRGGNNAVVYFY